MWEMWVGQSSGQRSWKTAQMHHRTKEDTALQVYTELCLLPTVIADSNRAIGPGCMAHCIYKSVDRLFIVDERVSR